MTNMQERLNAAVDTTEADSALFHTIVHGDDQTVVQTEMVECQVLPKQSMIYAVQSVPKATIL